MTTEHKSVLYAILARASGNYGGGIVFGIYPVIISLLTKSETIAGIFISVATFFQFMVMDMMAGPFLDKYGVKKVGMIALLISIASATPFLFEQNIVTATILFLGLLIRSSFFVVDPLILQSTKANEGGFWFGLNDEIKSLGDLLGALSIPFFIITERWMWIGVVWIIAQLIAFILLSQVKKAEKIPKTSLQIKFNLFQTLKAGLHFINVNHKYPLFVIGHALFEGIFYGAIWFVLPLYLASQVITNGGSLSLGIYEVVTICVALLCGFIADRVNWKILEEYAWILMILMVWILPFYNSINALVIVGVFIGLANNFFTASGNHTLAQHDEDHEEDGQFTSCARVIMNIGYASSPVIVGYLYQYISFSASLVFIASCVTLIGIWMLSLYFKLKA